MKTSASAQLTRIPLIAIHIQIIHTRRRPHALIPLHRVHPACPAAPWFRSGPVAVGREHAFEAEDPGRELDVHKGDVGAEEERAGGVGRLDEGADFGFQGFGFVDLFFGVLRLEEAVEVGEDFAVDVVRPEAAVGAGFGVALGEEGEAGGEVFEVFH